MTDNTVSIPDNWPGSVWYVAETDQFIIRYVVMFGAFYAGALSEDSEEHAEHFANDFIYVGSL